MNNYVAPPDATLYWTNDTGSTVLAGAPVDLADCIGVAHDDIANNAAGVLKMAGVFNLPKATGVAWSAGARVNLASDEITSGAGTAAGIAYSDVVSGDTTCLVSINR